MTTDISPRVEETERKNGYLYRQHTEDFLFAATEWENTTTQIQENFAQDLAVDQHNMTGDINENTVRIVSDEVTSIHPEANKDEQTADETQLAEEALRLSKPFRPFTKASYDRLVRIEHERKLKEQNRAEKADEGRLVDGEIVFDDVPEDEGTTRKFDPKMADGNQLPEKAGRFPRDLDGCPIEEIDKYIKEKTFVIVAKKFKKFTIFRFNASNSLFLFPPWSLVRKIALRIICHQFFDLVILATILTGCALMIIDPQQNFSDPVVRENFINAQSVVEYVFQGVYTLEMILKILSRGFILSKYSYLRDGWNWLDFIVVLLGYITIIVEFTSSGGAISGLTGLRAFRVLRALKSISVVPGLRMIVNALLGSMGMLAEVMILILFCVAVFALFALQLYMGVLRQKCVANMPDSFTFCNESVLNPSPGDLCFKDLDTFKQWWINEPSHYQLGLDGYAQLCGTVAGTHLCDANYTCMQAGDNPNFGYTHFDNFGWAMLTTFQATTLDTWEDVYNRIIMVVGPWNMLFFMITVLFGAFYLLRLMLAVVAMAYEAEADAEDELAAEEAEEEKAKAKRKENTAMLFDPKKLKLQLLQKAKEEEEAKRLAEQGVAFPRAHTPLDATTHQTEALPNEPSDGIKSTEGKPRVPRPTTAKGEFLKTNMATAFETQHQDVNFKSAPKQDTIELMDMVEDDKMERGHTPSPTKTQGSEVTASGVRADMQSNNTLNTDPADDQKDDEIFFDDLPPINDRHRRFLLQKFAVLWLNKIKSEEEIIIDRNCLCCAKSAFPMYHSWLKVQTIFYKVATDGLFELFITLCIIANTIVMATEHYDRCDLCQYCPGFNPNITMTGQQVKLISECIICANSCDSTIVNDYVGGGGMSNHQIHAMDICNVVFSLIFTCEAIVKLIALSKEYFVGWNIFDLVIVIFSIPDVIIFCLESNGSNVSNVPGLSELSGVVKIFRLMRIMKLAQAWSTMRTLLGLVFSTMGALGNLSVILLIIVFIFAVLGNQLLGDNYVKYQDLHNYPELADYNGKIPRWHFHEFFHSLVMVFRILCGEWIQATWDCMRVNNEILCVVFFLLTLILGNFMVLNLFLALLLNAFSSDNIKQDETAKSENKIAKSLRRIKHCFTGSRQNRVITPVHDQIIEQEESRPQTRLEAILDNRKPSVAVNGSQQSIRSLIKATDPKIVERSKLLTREDNMSHLSNGELKMNGSKTSRAGSVISVVSNGVPSTGSLKHKGYEMSPYNLQQIESGFSTDREQYSKFEAAMQLSQNHSQMRTPIILTNDLGKDSELYTSAEQLTDKEKHSEVGSRKLSVQSAMTEEEDKKEEGAEVEIVDGHIVIPDCFCAVCHKNEKFHTCCPSCWDTLRLNCAKISTHPVFEGFILFLIAVSSFALCAEDVYLSTRPTLQQALLYLNIVFTVIFFLELVLKMFTLGLKKYMTSFWTILDFVIVCISIIDTVGNFVSGPNISAFRSLRTLRALRPLRAISRWEGMKIVVNALIFAMPAIGSVLAVCMVFWLIFAIFAVQTFRGFFYLCQDSNGNRVTAVNDITLVQGNPFCSNNTNATMPLDNTTLIWPSDLSQCNTSLREIAWPRLCMELGGTWYNPKINFDDVLSAYLALFQVSLFEGWMEVMDSSIDSPTTIGQQPYFESRLAMYVFFMIFIIFGSFFTLNLFIGVIIDNFNVLKKKYDGSYLATFLTENQRNYFNTLKKLTNKKPQKTIRRPKNAFQSFFFDIATNSKFEISITLVIGLNMIVMMMDYQPGPDTLKGVINTTTGEYILSNPPTLDHEQFNFILEILNVIFTIVFIVEAFIKIMGLRLHYFRRAWNVFDFIVTSLSVLGNVFEFLQQSLFISPTLLRVVRAFRIGRVLRLVKAAKGIRKLLFALVISIPALFNVGTLLFLFMFIYSILGMTLFSNVRLQGGLSDTVNFQTFGNSMVLLFRIMTSAGWNDILDSLMEETNCTPSVDCGNWLLAIIFLVSYLFIVFMIITNMYIAIILENFALAHEQEEIGITEDDFEMFYVVWEQYDPHATQYIKLEDLPNFLAEVEPPLGIPKPNSMAIVAFNLPIVEGDRIHCLDILMALVKRFLQGSDEDGPNMSEEHRHANEKLREQVAAKYKAAFPNREKIAIITTTLQRKKEDVAAKTLQRAWRNHRMRLNIKRIKELAREQTHKEDSLSHRLSTTLGSVKSRISSAVSRISRRGSNRSIRSNASVLAPEHNGFSHLTTTPTVPHKGTKTLQ